MYKYIYTQIRVSRKMSIRNSTLRYLCLVMDIFKAMSDGIVSKTLNSLDKFFNVYSTTILLKQKKNDNSNPVGSIMLK